MIQMPRFKAAGFADPAVQQQIARRRELYQWSTMALSLRHDRQEEQTLHQALVVFKELVLELQSFPPLGIAFDLMALWERGDQFVPRPLEASDRPLERLLFRLQNEIYYRLLRSPRFALLRSRWMALSNQRPEPPKPKNLSPATLALLKPFRKPPELLLSPRERGLSYLLSTLFAPLRQQLAPPFGPQLYPSATSLDWSHNPLSVIEALEQDLEHPGWFSEHISEWLSAWMRLSDEELLPETCDEIVLHFPQLQTKLDRIRWQQIARVSHGIPPSKELRRFFTLRDTGYRELLLPARSVAPEGGYHGLTRHGPIQNMLHSELLFWDADLAEDVFALRWAEREVLYYEREQEITFTWQRRITVLLDLDPGEIRFKTPELPAPGHALLLGFLARLFLDLREICPEELLRFGLLCGPAPRWKEQLPLLRLVFGNLPDIGASTHLGPLEDSYQWSMHHPPGMGELRMLIATPSRWRQLRQQTFPVHLSLVVAPDAESLREPDEDREEAPPHDPHPFPMPDFSFVLSRGGEETFQALAQLRDDVIESILRTSLVSQV